MYPAVPDRHLPSITPLTARSVALSTLLGYHPPALPVSALVKVGELFGITDRATRVALTRMVKDGEVTVDNGVYRLSERLLRRQAEQDGLTSPPPGGGLGGGRWPSSRARPGPWQSGWHCARAWCGTGWASCARVCGCGRTTCLVSSTASSPTSASFLSLTTLTRRARQRLLGLAGMGGRGGPIADGA